MRDIHFLYGIATLAVVGILACFTGYTTGTPQSKHRRLQRAKR